MRPGTIIGAAAAATAIGLVGYAAWFDYERRHNPEFRRKLFKEQRRQRKEVEVREKQAQAGQADALRSAVRQMKNEAPPASVEERESYFLEQVAIGEALAAKGPAFYVPAAISFFKGLQVYPQPQELLMIYQRTQPAEVVALLMEALRISITDMDDESSSSSQQRQGGGASRLQQARSSSEGGAILEEIDTEDSAEASPKRSTSSKGQGQGYDTTTPPTTQNDDDNNSPATSTSSPNTAASGSGSGSYVNVEYPQSAEKIY